MIQPKVAASNEDVMMKQEEMDNVIASFGNAPMNKVIEAKKESNSSSDDEMNRSVGECDSDELDGDLNLSDNEE